MTALPPRFDITAEQIDTVVRRFYAAIRRHPELGPVFAAHVPEGGWPAHKAKIAAFWRNAILHERGYDGSPMRAHLAAPEIREHHFALWLGLFDHTLRSSDLPPVTAAAFSALAHRIGRGQRAAIQDRDRPADAPPRLL